MCGIFGYITNERGKGSAERRKFIEQATVVGTVRGDDGAGLFIVPHDAPEGATADWVKAPTDGYSLVASKAFHDRLGPGADFHRYRAVIGHNRSATAGSICLANTHPFQEGPITLVHNGTLSSTQGLAATMHDLKGEGVEVDSHVICHNLAIADDPKHVLELLEGAFVLVWHDARDDSINVVRNSARPIHLMGAACEDTVLIASEAEMLHWLAVRNNFVPGDIVYPKPGHLLKWTPGAKLPEVREIPLYAPRAAKGHQSYAPWPRTGQSYSSTSSGGTTTTPILPAVRASSLPQLAKEALAKLNLTGESQLRFVPHQISPAGSSAIVNGLVTLPGRESPINGRLVGLSYTAIQNALSNREVWTISPVMVTHLPEGEPFLHGRLLIRKWEEPKPTPQTDGSGRKIMPPRAGNRGSNEYLPGPCGEMVDLYEWLRHTADGCVQCGVLLAADDAETITWVEGGSRPLCDDCRLDNIGWGRMH